MRKSLMVLADIGSRVLILCICGKGIKAMRNYLHGSI